MLYPFSPDLQTHVAEQMATGNYASEDELLRSAFRALAEEESNRRSSSFYYDNRTTASYDQLVEHYDALRVKYEQAADRPWLFVAPDPPEPSWPNGVQRR
jgi:Arc/MetJ-type ribon-helix-helix transcriptional regulator